MKKHEKKFIKHLKEHKEFLAKIDAIYNEPDFFEKLIKSLKKKKDEIDLVYNLKKNK